MADYYGQLKHAIARLDDLRDEALLEQLRAILEMAKQNDDGGTVAEFAQHLIQAGSHFGRLEFEMIGFGEMCALYQRDPAYADLKQQILWYYKWLAERLPEYVEIPASRVQAFLDQMENFYREADEGLRPVYELRCRAACFMGDDEAAHRNYELWTEAEKKGSDDCPACETHSRILYLLSFGKIEEAIQAAEPILSGEQACDEVPATTFSRLLLPFLFTREPNQALALSFAVRRQVRHTPGLLSHLSDHVNLLALLGIWELARRALFVMLNRVQSSPNAYVQFCVARSAWLCLARMNKGDVKQIRFPSRTELADQTLETAQAAEHFRKRATELARAFDERHGTADFAKRVEAIQKLAEL